MENVYRGDVQVFGGLAQEGAVIRRARITTLGSVAKLSRPDLRSRRYEQADRITDVEVSEDGDKVVFAGVSEQLTAEVGLHPPDTKVRWVLHPKGCRTC